mgnify:CR=1 FL=1
MSGTLAKINSLLTRSQRWGLIILILLLFIGMILEVFGLGIIIPMINILLDPEMVENTFGLRSVTRDFFYESKISNKKYTRCIIYHR